MAIRIVRYASTTSDLEGEINKTLKKAKGTLISIARDGPYYIVAIASASKAVLP